MAAATRIIQPIVDGSDVQGYKELNNNWLKWHPQPLLQCNRTFHTSTTPSNSSEMPSYVVTGASRGLGYAWITHLASIPGNTVVTIVRNKKATEERLAKDDISNIHVFSTDVTDLQAVKKAAEETSKITKGSLDILIHNAAVVSERSGFITPLDDSPEEFDKDLLESFNANVIGTAHVVNAFLPLVRKGKAKKIIVISSGMADLDIINRFDIAIAAPYSISKAASNALVAKYHAALGKSEGILFLSLSPGLVDTREGKPLSEEEIKGGQAMGAKFAEYAPHFTGPISPQESVEFQIKVIERATVKEFGGAFVSHFGDQQWL